LRNPAAVTLAVLSGAASLMSVGAFWILLTAGLIGLIFKLSHGARIPAKATAGPLALGLMIRLLSAAKAQTAALARLVATSENSPVIHPGFAYPVLTLASLSWFFLKVGFIFFGGGFVLIPVLHHHLVDELRWLSVREFLDGVAISQLTPGPIAVLATFAGYRIAGSLGAILATAALFIPSMLLMLIIAHHYQRLQNFHPAQNFLAGIAPAAIGLIAAAAVILTPGNLHPRHPLSILLGALAFYLLVRRKWHPAFVLLLGAVIGTLLPGWLA
jgi:chromate transporter